MKAGAVGYTPGTSPGSHYQRFGNSGLIQSRNMQSMNRSAVEKANTAMINDGPQIFEAKTEQVYGLSELAAQQVLKRAQDVADKLAAGVKSLSAANGGNGAAVNQIV
jgi:hypothetical protein